MKAVLWTAYGGPEVLRLGEHNKPSPKPNEILIKVHASTVTAGDCEARRSDFPAFMWLPARLYFGLFKPRLNIQGQELSGDVVEVGSEVTRFKCGDKVFAATLMKMGALAEFCCLPESYPIALKSNALSYAEATTIPTGGINGLHFLNKAKIAKGDKLLIIGAGGSIGTYAVQIAKQWSAQVTCVDSAEKLPLLQQLGADFVIDYKTQDYYSTEERYDAIIDIVGKSVYSKCIALLKDGGRYVLGNPRISGMLRGVLTSKRSTKKVLFEMAGYKPEDIETLLSLFEKGVLKAHIDKRYSMAQVAEAHKYVEEGRKTGNIVIDVCSGENT